MSQPASVGVLLIQKGAVHIGAPQSGTSSNSIWIVPTGAKVPSLRNIAVSSPYMHNGAFKNLRQVLAFYNTRDIGPWPAPEVAANVNREELGNLGLSEQEIGDIVVFLHTLTDNYPATGKDRLRKE